MERVGIKTATIHSDKEQQDRSAVLRQFREGEVRILIATDVSARGIDIPGVTYVINYDLPEQAENYVHRVGRTGRGKSRGQALSFCSPNETELLEAIEAYIGKAIKVLDVERGEYENTRLLSEDAGLSLEDMLSEIEALETEQKRKKKKK
jgi:ATP-dependent RNA helicase RhlE